MQELGYVPNSPFLFPYLYIFHYIDLHYPYPLSYVNLDPFNLSFFYFSQYIWANVPICSFKFILVAIDFRKSSNVFAFSGSINFILPPFLPIILVPRVAVCTFIRGSKTRSVNTLHICDVCDHCVQTEVVNYLRFFHKLQLRLPQNSDFSVSIPPSIC